MDADLLLQFYIALWLAVLGAALGSFLCCAADRGGLPTGRSRCDGCGHVLGVGELIPIFSYLFSRGRCRHCGGAIPVRCLVAELVGAAGFAALGLKFGPSLELVMQLILAGLLLLLSLVDWTTHILPDKLLLVAIVNRVAFLVLLQEPLGETLPQMALGAFSVSLPLLLLSLVMDALLKKDTLGGGDIKLLFVLGLYLSWLEMLLLLVLACVLALAWAAGPGRRQSGAEIPLGPFLAAAWLAVTLFGGPLIQWYLSLLG
ncbi:prepilin peptidase [Intestinimonas sp. HCP28S3_D6]|uniref:prepilin peptidase n=1 Tax=Intestinimonas sp. HCP28S3_D6 TaxID=3438942 RepID=UPI003F89CEE7